MQPAPDPVLFLDDGLVCVRAPNPSPMTYWGTNTYLLGQDALAVIDPGPDDPAHLQKLLDVIGGRQVSHILVTHSHLDHSPLARALADHTGAPVLAFGDSSAGRSPRMAELARSGLMGGGEGVDRHFAPDQNVQHGDLIAGHGWSLRALHTPGHFGNHMTFVWGQTAFTGDHVMGWATSLVSPPDGDLTDFMASCRMLQDTGATRGLSAHGGPIDDLQSRLNEIIAHRMGREAEILDLLSTGPQTPAKATRQIYTDVAPALLPMAQRNVLAHLVDLYGRGLVTAQGPLSADAHYALA